MTEPSRFARTPTATIMITQLVAGAALLVFAFLNAVSVSGDQEALLAVGLGAMGGTLAGQGLGSVRQRRAVSREH